MFNVESGKGYGMPHSKIREVHLYWNILAIDDAKRPGVHNYYVVFIIYDLLWSGKVIN